MFTYEFGTIEWLWDQETIQVNLPGDYEEMYHGNHKEIVTLLSDLGSQGWDVASCSSTGNWLFWTLRRHRS
ncbi:hypothetical protein FXF65_32910 [Actinomadura syzygii]|uniref:DUF4177 domain-containing protein n=1 Tax=Actinomadura syzygii TaxID=1427538 RepID=A0A5D0TYX1_9ACTN|nr:hypothetical protein FXF65_32910 [Actinomadura syzygii]